jgi:hypothetical protein
VFACLKHLQRAAAAPRPARLAPRFARVAIP